MCTKPLPESDSPSHFKHFPVYSDHTFTGEVPMKTVIIIILIITSLTAQSQLRGNWVSSSYGTPVSLRFKNENELIYDGELSYYAASANIIRIQEDYGFVDYPYVIQNGQLKIQFPDGSVAVFTRQSSTQKTQPAQSTQSYSSSNGQLRGWLCSWSGSSGSYSSYSSTTNVYFDGNGRFTVRSESSFSGDAGQAYSGGGGGESGSYSVNGSQITLIFQDGSRGVAQVKMQQNSGQITEIMYNGTLFATGLCE